MWKTAFCIGMMLSLEARAVDCRIQNIEDVAALFKNSPQEKQYQAINLDFIEKSKQKKFLRTRPEFAVSFDADKSEVKNNELNVSLFFNLSEYSKYELQKKAAESEAQLKIIEQKNASVERVTEVSVAYFKVAQNFYFNQKMDALLSTVKSSEETYSRRSIKSRDDEIVLSSLRLIKDNLALKKALRDDQMTADQNVVDNQEVSTCVAAYEDLSKSLETISSSAFPAFNEENSLKLQELKIQELSVFATADFEHNRKITNLKIGPIFSRQVVQGESENRFGLGLSMDWPAFDNQANTEFSNSVKSAEAVGNARSKVVEIRQHSYLIKRLKKYLTLLKQIHSVQKIEGDIMRMKKSFDLGVLSPLVYLDSYRSYVDYLETSQEAELQVFETYLKLRGAYVENNNL